MTKMRTEVKDFISQLNSDKIRLCA